MFFKNRQTLELLTQSGWTENRVIDSKIIIDFYYANGCPIIEKAISFLKSFYGITIMFTNKRTQQLDNFSFNLIRAFEIEVMERIKEDYEPRIRRELCIIGTAYREHFVLLMDDLGVVYGGYDHFFVEIAKSGYEAIEAIINDSDFLEIK